MQSLAESLIGHDFFDAELFALLLANLFLVPDYSVQRSIHKYHVEDIPNFSLAFEYLRGEEDGGGDHDFHLVLMRIRLIQKVEVVHGSFGAGA